MVDATVPGVEVQFYVVPRTVLVVVVVLVSLKEIEFFIGFPPYTLSLGGGGAIRAENRMNAVLYKSKNQFRLKIE